MYIDIGTQRNRSKGTRTGTRDGKVSETKRQSQREKRG